MKHSYMALALLATAAAQGFAADPVPINVAPDAGPSPTLGATKMPSKTIGRSTKKGSYSQAKQAKQKRRNKRMHP